MPVQRNVSSQSTYDQAKATYLSDQANVLNQTAGVALAGINLGYTNVVAPFDGVVTDHLVSVGGLVGSSAPTKLASIVQLDPIYVNFNVSEQDVLLGLAIVLLVALAAKNAILIVEVAGDRRAEGEPILRAAVDAARVRFRPILMTSFAFILGVVPRVTARGAGAAARVSLGLSVFGGMIASTCLAVRFVPSFFVVLQRLEEAQKARAQVQLVAE